MELFDKMYKMLLMKCRFDSDEYDSNNTYSDLYQFCKIAVNNDFKYLMDRFIDEEFIKTVYIERLIGADGIIDMIHKEDRKFNILEFVMTDYMIDVELHAYYPLNVTAYLDARSSIGLSIGNPSDYRVGMVSLIIDKILDAANINYDLDLKIVRVVNNETALTYYTGSCREFRNINKSLTLKDIKYN